MTTSDQLRRMTAHGHALLAEWRGMTAARFTTDAVDSTALYRRYDTPSLDMATRQERLGTVAWCASWVQDGCPTFTLTHGLEAALLLTECNHVRTENVRLPFDAFAVVLPSPSAISCATGAAARAPATWLRVHRHDVVIGAQDVVVTRHERGTAASLRALNDALRDAARCPRLDLRIVTQADTELRYGARLPHLDANVETWIKNNDADERAPLETHATAALHRHTIAAMVRLVVNLGLYLAEQARDAPASPSRRDGPASSGVHVVGREIKLPREIRESASAYADRGVDRARWRVASQFTVRGHWQRYHTGVGRNVCVLNWIKPYVKGPKDGVVLPRDYAVDVPSK